MLRAATINNPTVDRLQQLLEGWPGLEVVVLFGSVADNTASPQSDLDVAVQMVESLTATEKMALIDTLALAFGRPVDIIDLREAGQPLLGEIVDKGVMVIGDSAVCGDLLFKSVMMNEDFVPYQRRILEARRQRWLAQ